MQYRNTSFRGNANATLYAFGQDFCKMLMDMNPMLRKFMGG